MSFVLILMGKNQRDTFKFLALVKKEKKVKQKGKKVTSLPF